MSDAESQLADLARRVARLEAVEAIQQLKYRYWRACDAKDAAAFRDCFVREGADIDYGPGIGRFDDREPLVEVYTRLARRREDDHWLFHDVHHGMHPDIEVLDDGSATGSWTFGFLRVNLADGRLEQASMEYRDRYVVEDGEWRIQRSHVIPLTAFSYPLPEGIQVAPGPRP